MRSCRILHVSIAFAEIVDQQHQTDLVQVIDVKLTLGRLGFILARIHLLHKRLIPVIWGTAKVMAQHLADLGRED